jgi:predicted ATPase/DNA-binding winged helix-turn-helix (wHTH) protein
VEIAASALCLKRTHHPKRTRDAAPVILYELLLAVVSARKSFGGASIAGRLPDGASERAQIAARPRGVELGAILRQSMDFLAGGFQLGDDERDATMPEPTKTNDAISFGPFSLVASERLLTKGGEPVALGSRALDVLIALTSRPNAIVGKKDLMAQVWPDVFVDEASLRFHIAGLRRALGDGEGAARYIATVPGRGYCFVAPVSRSSDRDGAHRLGATGFSYANLPGRLNRMVGRADDVVALTARVTVARFVTIVGAGGVGKTTVAVAVGHDLIDAFQGAVLFVDLGMLSDPTLVVTAVASMLGLSVHSDDATPSLIAYLRDKRVLLILDTCEHLIEAVGALASRIFMAAPQTHILATSREALRVEGEHIYRLDPLACPPEEPGLTAAAAQAFPATQLFVERAEAGGASLRFDDADTAIIGGICRKLDGVALAIELAASRIEAHGLQETAALLDQRLTLLWLGPRSSPPRQKTLQATLDWSYGLLSEMERAVLNRLAVFVGHFTLDAALAVVTSVTVDQALAFSAIDSLIAKSMVATRPVGAMMRYRLLDTTRAYLRAIRDDDAEFASVSARHANYYRQWLEQHGTEWPTLSTGAERTPHFAALNNVRAALEWAFGASGDVRLGVEVAAAAAPVFLSMSLLTECLRWSERALLALDAAGRGGREEMRLRAASGVSLMFTRGGLDAARAALERSLAIAEERGDVLDQVRLLGPLQMFHLRKGDFNTALGYARRCSVVARATEDSVASAVAHSILGISLHLNGALAAARVELEAAIGPGLRSVRTTTTYLGFEGRILAGGILARNLWLQGHPAQALERARQTVRDAAAMDHSLTLSIALIWAITVFLWTGDLESAEEYIDRLILRAETYSLGPYLLVARGFEGELAILRGDAIGGVETLEGVLERLHAAPYELLSTPLSLALARGLAAAGRLADGFALLDRTIAAVEEQGDHCYLPELLRMRGRLLLPMHDVNHEVAEKCFEQSLELSLRQGARAWEIRTASDLAELWAGQGRAPAARALLEPLTGSFVEGRETADLKAATRLLASLA